MAELVRERFGEPVSMRVAYGQAIPWLFLGQALAISAALAWSFIGIGLAVSVWIRQQARAMVYLLLLWVLAVALLDFALIGMLLAWRLNAASVFVLACLNPVETARMALVASAEPSLASLGPVGFFLVNRIGQIWLFVLGVGWPLVAGTAAWWAARRRFVRSDLI